MKEKGQPKPWSEDPVFQKTYFTNVSREDDKVTKWIREFYNPWVGDPMFEYNMVFARFINWPETLKFIGYMRAHTPRQLEDLLNFKAEGGKIWGGAYVITTHGMPMPKAHYLTHHVLEDVYRALENLRGHARANQCGNTAERLQRVDGIGSFLAGQIVADLKNTPGHPLNNAQDRDTFVVPGPGSLRGLQWFHGEDKVHPTIFMSRFFGVRRYVDAHWPAEVPPVDNQDLQNCLCEFDKYCRVVTGTGRSKRKYEASR